MTNRLVNTCIVILRTLPSTGQNVSKIIEQTSPDRSHVSDAIKELHKSKIISREKNPKHKQGIIIKPTELGLELKKLMLDIEHYNKSFLAFKRSVHENIGLNRGFQFTELEDGRQVDHQTIPAIERLENMKWTPNEIDHFVKWADGTDFVLNTCNRNIFIALFFKYALIFYSHDTNDKAQHILRKIIIDEMIVQLTKISWRAEQARKSDRLSVFQKEASVYAGFLDIYDHIKKDIFSSYSGQYKLSSCRYVKQELRDLMQSLLSIVNSTNNTLEIPLSDEILSLMDKIEMLRSRNNSNAELDEEKASLNDYEELISIFNAAIRKSS